MLIMWYNVYSVNGDGEMQFKGRISAVSEDKEELFVQDEEGRIHKFAPKMLIYKHEAALLKPGTLVSYDNTDGVISNVKLIDDDDDTAYIYSEPDDFMVLGKPPFEGYELFDHGKFILAQGARDENHAKYKLVELCKGVGANCVIDFELKKELKVAMGYGFNFFYASGVPGVVARQNDQGEVSAKELRSRLDHEKIGKLGNMLVNIRLGKTIAKVLGLVLFLVFVIGFIYSL